MHVTWWTMPDDLNTLAESVTCSLGSIARSAPPVDQLTAVVLCIGLHSRLYQLYFSLSASAAVF